MSLDLADLVNLELQLKRDADASRAELAERDEDIRAAIGAPPDSRWQLLKAWIEACRERDTERALVGRAVEKGYRAAGLVLAAVALLVGWGTAAGLFRFTGDHPINVLTVLGVLVVAQIVILTVTLISLAIIAARPGALEGLPGVGALRDLVRTVSYRIARMGKKGEDREAQLRRVAAFVAGRRALYVAVERAMVFRTLQLGSVAFNLGALGCMLSLVAFSDLAFGWSTTLDLAGTDLRSFCAGLAAPWSWVAPDAVPSAELIDATRYSRFDGAYVDPAATAARAGRWWSFLAMAVATYGLLPRAVLFAVGQRATRRAVARAPLDTPEVDALVRRLTTRRISRHRGEEHANVRPLGLGAESVKKPGAVAPDQPVLCVRWRDAQFGAGALDAVLRDDFSADRAGDVGAAGGYDYGEDEAFLARVAAADDTQPVFVIAEPWAAPDRAFKRFVRDLRLRGGGRRHVNILLTAGGSPTDRQTWAGYLAELADPYLSLDPDAEVPAEAAAS